MSLQKIATPQALAGLEKDAPVLLAFSGGADSRALLHLLYAQSVANGFSLTLAHVNHGIRGDEAIRDREFCRSVADAYGLELCILDADVPTLAKTHGRGIEEEARIVRYAYFEQLMRERSIRLLVTAHHADDNLETVLLHMCRGSGLSGLCGIAPVRAFGSGYLARPLLSMSRHDIEAFCREEHLEYVTDSTNAELICTRNRLRGEVIPVLSSLYRDLPQRAFRMTEDLREDEAFLTSMATELIREAEIEGGLSLRVLRRADTVIQKRALMQWVSRKTGHMPERTHIRDLQEWVMGDGSSAEVALPGEHCAVIERGFLRIRRIRRIAYPPYRYEFAVGTRLLADGEILLEVAECDQNTKIHNLSTESYINLRLNFDIIKSGLFWRSYREGDTLLRAGMHKKLRKLYGEADVPVRWRAVLPLLCDGEGILWAPFVGVRDGVLTKEETHCIGVRVYPQE